ncbi:MAG: InlB B-repeat-containing protein [Candidatus Coproplasma sp.]
MQDYGTALRKLRRHFNMTQKELADKLNVASQTVSKWENGINQIDIIYLQDLSTLFGISVDDFIRLADGQPLESVLSSSAQDIRSDNSSPEGTTAQQITQSPEQTTVQNNPLSQQVATGSANNNSGINPNISPDERAKSFFKDNLPSVIIAIVMFFIVIALVITTVCVTKPSLTANQIYEKVNPSVFYIEVDTADGKQAGSGFFIDSKGTAVTNYHVIKGGSNAKVTLPDGNKYDVESIIGCDSARDLVLLKVDIDRSVPVQQGNSDKLKTGDKVYAIGYPQSFILGAEDSTFTDGIISKPAYNIDGVNYIQTTVDITNGNSGGVLINSEGKVVGITTGKIDIGGVTYMNLALPINNIGSIDNDINLPLQDFSSIYKDVTVTYMAGNDIYSQKTIANGTRLPQSDGDRHGYTFEGWFKDSECLTPFDFNTPVDGDTTIYGKWTELPHYTVTYAFGNEVYTTAKLYEGEKVSKISCYISGYNFDGWYSDPDLTTTFDFNQKISGDITVYGRRTPISFVIVFDPNGGVGEAVRVDAKFGESITMPECSFTQEGYKFAGWRKIRLYQTGQVVEAEFTYIEGEEVVFKAEWEAAKYTLTFDVDGGKIPNHYQPYFDNCDYNDIRELPDTPILDGYIFTGWYLNGKTYQSRQEVLVSDIAGSSNTITFKALWEAKEYTIYYIVNLDSDGRIEKQQKCKVGEKVILPTQIDELPAGYYLNYWYKSSGTYKKFSLGQVITNEDLNTYGDDVKLYADWWGITYYVDCIDSITGESYDKLTCYYGQEVDFDFLKNKPYRQGYNYTWQLYNDDGTPYTGEEGKITTEAGKTVIAKTVYTPITYSLSFMVGNSYDGYKEVGSTTLKYDEEFNLPEEWCVSDTGYTFQYFSGPNDEQFVAGDVIKNLTDYDEDTVYLYSKQRQNVYSIAFDPNGGSGEMPNQSAICADEITINTNTFEKEGYYFTGWEYGEETYSDGGTIKMFLDEGTVITLVAQWGKNLDGEGTQLSPYKVASYEDLITMADMVEKSVVNSKAYYVLTADIDCQTQPIKAIGGSTNPFSGTFDGNNHIISNAKFEETGEYIGLFGYVELGSLKNFGVKNFQMTGGGTAKYCGAVAGKYVSDKTIENVFAKGTLNLSFGFGMNTVAGVHVGGLVGSLTGSAKNCYFEGSLSASTKSSGLNTSICAGGFAGSIYGNNVEIDGVNYSISPDISCCYVNSGVTVNSGNGSYTKYRMGGFVGTISSPSDERVAFEYCVSIGDVKNINTSSTGFYGGFVGQNSAGADLSLVRRDATSVCEGKGTVCADVLQEDLSKLKNVQWLIDEFGFSADIWADEYGLPMLKAYIKETV